MRFSELNLISPILAAADAAGYTEPSPIQQQAIPPVLAGRDLLGCAQTGTGKTAAFAMPILQLVYSRCRRDGARPVRALVLTPTRELALQIDESFAAYGARLPVRHTVIFGGVGQAPQVEKLRAGVDVLTATPGRLNDLIAQGHVDLSSVEIFVLDEADRMLDMGFVQDVRKVLRHLPKKRQTLLFSATMPREIEQLAASILHEPVRVMVTPPATTVEAIRQSVCFVDKGNKKHLLASLLQDKAVTSALVFTRTKHGADRVVRDLAKAGIQAAAIHGNKSQTARQTALTRFKTGQIRVLVATDIAARGIDVSGLSHVFNYDLPNVPETYVHRIGRTGRAGADGVAISFCCADEVEYLRDIEKLTRQNIPVCGHAWPMQEGPVPVQAENRPQKRKEEKKVMEQETQKQTVAAEGEGAPKKRRRRGGRRHNKNRQGAAAAQPAVQNAEAKAEKTEKKEKTPAQQPRAPKAAAERAAARQRPAKEAPRRQPRKEAEEVDDSIQLISRRAPAQKFASFEEYMKAHGMGGDEE